MESTGKKGCIQLSQQTTDILLQAGKKHWIVPREDKVEAKGKGEMQTYFLNIQSRDEKSDTGTSASESSVGDLFGDDNKDDAATLRDIEKRSRSAQWVVEILANLLKEIVAKRESLGIRKDPAALMEKLETMAKGNENTMVIDEVKEIITLPGFVKKRKSKVEDTSDLGDDVLEELKDYVIMAASLYNDNPFHCFDHAVHVSMSCTKLLARIATPDLDEYTAQEVFDHTYGITSDPLTQFATVFAALIHDIDHKGVPNSQLVNEGAPIADYYHNKSVAEQNSVDIAWELLMEDSYKNLRRTIYTTVAEFKRFRELVVNAVMATDIVDKDLKTLRNKRWEVAFDPNTHEDAEAARNRKATIVIEHLIQASDVAHTMQHWYIYRKWNEKFFRECYQAYLDGRAEKNPAEGWYQGELGFFDFYIIPLAKKLKECGVFGVSSDEYLSYAVENRKEWEKRGEMVVEEMKSQVESKLTPKRRSMEKP
ncbi:3'5'-cyclic nucleotide phosphodiesterase [Nitzschia inconspicua]|nr:3'5'-cyclic nucleotide phosphodiesterase [Nitzschia inconspicua]